VKRLGLKSKFPAATEVGGPNQVVLARKLGSTPINLQSVCRLEGELRGKVERKPQDVKANAEVC
jgi:hypothetical protein